MRSIAQFANEILEDIATSPDAQVKTVNPEIVRRIAQDLLARRTTETGYVWVVTSGNQVLGVHISETDARKAKAKVSGGQVSLMELK